MSPLAADLSGLPRPARSEGTGLTPDQSPRFVGVLVDAWAAAHDDDKPTALGTRVRHSDAGKCARAIAYTAAGIPRSDPMDLAGVWNTTLGTLLHEEWQAALLRRFVGAEVEVTCGWDDLDASGHIDAVIRTDDRVVCLELKTCGGTPYKYAIGKASRGRPAEGPKTEHLLQGALNASAIGADELVIAYLAKECISVNVADGMSDLARFSAEWTFTREDFEPLAKAERDRLAGILALLDEGKLAARKVPDLPPGAEIVDPASGRWEVRDGDAVVDTGSYFMCRGYCNYRTLCATTEPGRIPVESVAVDIGGVA